MKERHRDRAVNVGSITNSPNCSLAVAGCLVRRRAIIEMPMAKEKGGRKKKKKKRTRCAPFGQDDFFAFFRGGSPFRFDAEEGGKKTFHIRIDLASFP